MDGVDEPEMPEGFPVDLSGAHSAFAKSFVAKFVGYCFAYIDVPADPAIALRRASEVELPLLLAALSLDEEQPYRIYPAFAIDGPELVSRNLGVFAFWDDEGFGEDRIEATRMVLTALGANATGARAARHLAHGFVLHDMEPSIEVLSSALLSYFKVIEGIAGSTEIPVPQDADEQRAAIVTSLREKLDRQSLLKKQVAAINQARDALQRIDAKFLDLKIRATGRFYGLGEAWIERSGALLKFRNKKLGHSGSTPPSLEELEVWLDRGPSGAPALAKTLLSAHISAEG